MIIALAVLIVMYCVFFGELALSYKTWPERLATHFRFDGVPNGWMSRRVYAIVIVIVALLVPLVPLAWALAAAPPKLGASLGWMSCLTLGFLCGVHAVTIQSNRQAEPRLSPLFWVLLLTLMLGVVAWVASL